MTKWKKDDPGARASRSVSFIISLDGLHEITTTRRICIPPRKPFCSHFFPFQIDRNRSEMVRKLFQGLNSFSCPGKNVAANICYRHTTAAIPSNRTLPSWAANQMLGFAGRVMRLNASLLNEISLGRYRSEMLRLIFKFPHFHLLAFCHEYTAHSVIIY